jgi:hypothetical protein
MKFVLKPLLRNYKIIRQISTKKRDNWNEISGKFLAGGRRQI